MSKVYIISETSDATLTSTTHTAVMSKPKARLIFVGKMLSQANWIDDKEQAEILEDGYFSYGDYTLTLSEVELDTNTVL